MAETPTLKEQVAQLAGDLGDIRTTIDRIHNHGYDRPHLDLDQFIQDNCRLLDRQIHTAVERVSVLNRFKRRIRNVPCKEWQDGLRDTLRQLRKRSKDFADLHKSDDYELAREGESSALDNLPTRVFSDGYARGCRSFILDISPIRVSIVKCIEDLEKTDFSDDAIEKSKAARKPRKPAKRRRRAPKMTDNQRDALRVYDREKTYAAVADHLTISPAGARELVIRAQRNRAAIESLAAERASGKSVNLDRNLSHDKRGQALAEAPEPHKD